MSVRIEISPRASVDLETIVNYTTRQWVQSQSDQYIAEIFAALDLLRDTPHLGLRALRTRGDLRILRTAGHRAYYQIREDHIWVIRILHPSQRVDLTPE